MRAYAEVPYPPPAALVEVVPNAPGDDGAVWVDGHWLWRGRYYVWERGGWLLPPEGASLSVNVSAFVTSRELSANEVGVSPSW